jgi:hypothetical protein
MTLFQFKWVFILQPSATNFSRELISTPENNLQCSVTYILWLRDAVKCNSKIAEKNVYSSTFNAFEFYAGLEVKVDEWRINHKFMHINIESTLYFVFERISYYTSDDCNTLRCSTIQLYYILDSERTYWFLWLNDRYMYFVLEYLFRKTLCGLL